MPEPVTLAEALEKTLHYLELISQHPDASEDVATESRLCAERIDYAQQTMMHPGERFLPTDLSDPWADWSWQKVE